MIHEYSKLFSGSIDIFIRGASGPTLIDDFIEVIENAFESSLLTYQVRTIFCKHHKTKK